jgi:hypothetical protein
MQIARREEYVHRALAFANETGDTTDVGNVALHAQLASLLVKKGDFEEAEILQRRVLQADLAVYGGKQMFTICVG